MDRPPEFSHLKRPLSSMLLDRAWFRSAISGRDTFSQPLVSRTSGNRISNGSGGVGVYHNAAGVSVVGSYNFIPLFGWGMIVETEESSAMSEVNTVFWILVSVSSVILIVVGFTVVMMVHRSITKPLKRAIQGLTGASEQVASASVQVSSSSQSMAEGSSEQAASLEETSSSLEQIATQTKQNADNANQANRSVKDSSEMINQGVTSMKRMSTAIMDKVVQSNAANSEETASVAEELSSDQNST